MFYNTGCIRCPRVRWWCGVLYIIESNGTALLVEAALFIPGYEYDSPATPSDFDRLISGYRTLLRRPHWGTPTLLPIVLTLFFMGENDERKLHDFIASATQNSLPRLLDKMMAGLPSEPRCK